MTIDIYHEIQPNGHFTFDNNLSKGARSMFCSTLITSLNDVNPVLNRLFISGLKIWLIKKFI